MTAQTSLLARIVLTLGTAIAGTGTLIYATAEGSALSLGRTPAVVVTSSGSARPDLVESRVAPSELVAAR